MKVVLPDFLSSSFDLRVFALSRPFLLDMLKAADEDELGAGLGPIGTQLDGGLEVVLGLDEVAAVQIEPGDLQKLLRVGRMLPEADPAAVLLAQAVLGRA